MDWNSAGVITSRGRIGGRGAASAKLTMLVVMALASTTTAEAALVAQVSASVSPMGKSKALKTMKRSVRSAGP